MGPDLGVAIAVAVVALAAKTATATAAAAKTLGNFASPGIRIAERIRPPSWSAVALGSAS